MPRRADLSRERWTIMTRELAHVLGIDAGNIKRLALDGMPKEGTGRWYLPDCLRWYIGRKDEAAEAVDLDLGKRKAMLYESQEQKNRIDIAQKLGLLIPADEVESALATLAQQFVDSLESIPSRLDAPAPVISAVELEIRAARRDLATSLQAAAKRFRGGDEDHNPAE